MKRFIIAAVVMMLSVPAMASDEAKVEHYASKEITTEAQAQTTLDVYNAEVKGILSAEKLSVGQMERIHEITYTLEKALPMVKGEGIKAAAEALEAVHLSSEDHDEAKLRENFKAYVSNL